MNIIALRKNVQLHLDDYAAELIAVDISYDKIYGKPHLAVKVQPSSSLTVWPLPDLPLCSRKEYDPA